MANGIPAACLPELTQHGGGALTSSKYFGKPGLDALSAILHHADRYGLKWVFVRDPYYEPLLSSPAGAVWITLKIRPSRCGARMECRRRCRSTRRRFLRDWQGLMWGIFALRQQHSGHLACV